MFNEIGYTSPQHLGSFGDYVHRGDTLYYAATIGNISGDPFGIIPGGQTPATRAMINAIIGDIRGEGFQILEQELIPASGSIAFNVRAPGDFGDSHDVQALFDGIVQSRGGQLRASNIQHRAINLADPSTLDPNIDKGALEVAGDWWGSGINSALDSAGQAIGLDKSILLIGGLAVIAVLLLRR